MTNNTTKGVLVRKSTIKSTFVLALSSYVKAREMMRAYEVTTKGFHGSVGELVGNGIVGGKYLGTLTSTITGDEYAGMNRYLVVTNLTIDDTRGELVRKLGDRITAVFFDPATTIAAVKNLGLTYGTV